MSNTPLENIERILQNVADYTDRWQTPEVAAPLESPPDQTHFGWYGRGRAVEAYMPVLPVTGDLTPSLALMRQVFEAAKSDNRKLIFRPRYNKDGSQLDAEFAVMLEHVSAIGPLVTEFAAQILVYQLGYVGRWGEFHGSLNVPEDDVGKRRELTQSVLASFPGFVAVRRPAWHMDVAPSLSNVDTERLTVFDDCIGCGDDDGGTFPSETAIYWREYMGKLKRVGGEISTQGEPKTFYEMWAIAKAMNLSYANIEWNPRVWESWTPAEMAEFTNCLENGWA